VAAGERACSDRQLPTTAGLIGFVLDSRSVIRIRSAESSGVGMQARYHTEQQVLWLGGVPLGTPLYRREMNEYFVIRV